jgi:hypothetical protein
VKFYLGFYQEGAALVLQTGDPAHYRSTTAWLDRQHKRQSAWWMDREPATVLIDEAPEIEISGGDSYEIVRMAK